MHVHMIHVCKVLAPVHEIHVCARIQEESPLLGECRVSPDSSRERKSYLSGHVEPGFETTGIIDQYQVAFSHREDCQPCHNDSRVSKPDSERKDFLSLDRHV